MVGFEAGTACYLHFIPKNKAVESGSDGLLSLRTLNSSEKVRAVSNKVQLSTESITIDARGGKYLGNRGQCNKLLMCFILKGEWHFYRRRREPSSQLQGHK